MLLKYNDIIYIYVLFYVYTCISELYTHTQYLLKNLYIYMKFANIHFNQPVRTPDFLLSLDFKAVKIATLSCSL